MDKNCVVCVIRPFVMEQNIEVYNNGKCVKVLKSSMKDIADNCYKVCKNYNLHSLFIKGPSEQYSAKIKDDLKATKFNNFTINITIV